MVSFPGCCDAGVQWPGGFHRTGCWLIVVVRPGLGRFVRSASAPAAARSSGWLLGTDWDLVRRNDVQPSVAGSVPRPCRCLMSCTTGEQAERAAQAGAGHPYAARAARTYGCSPDSLACRLLTGAGAGHSTAVLKQFGRSGEARIVWHSVAAADGSPPAPRELRGRALSGFALAAARPRDLRHLRPRPSRSTRTPKKVCVCV